MIRFTHYGSHETRNGEFRITNHQLPDHQLPTTNHQLMITVWMHNMFLRDSAIEESDLRLETEREVTLYELLDSVCKSDDTLRFKLLDEQKNLRPHVNIFIGTKNCRTLSGIETPVSVDEEVSVFPSLSGG